MNRDAVFLLTTLVCCLRPISGFVDTHVFLHKVFMDSEGDFLLKWTPQEDNIIFEMQVNTTGYAAIGFSPTGFMKGSDIVLAWIDDEGWPYLSDRHAVDNAKPLNDRSQDWRLLGGSRNGTLMTIRFTRHWRTCDDQDFELGNDTMRVIWATHPGLPTKTLDDVTFHRHTQRGSKSLLLVDNHDVKEPKTSDILFFDVTARNVTLPAERHNIYMCHLEKVPKLEKKHHIIGIKPILDEKNIKNIHHIMIYECRTGEQTAFEKLVEHPSVECYVEGMPPLWQQCQAVVFAWAVGSEGEIFPESTGMPIGGGVPQYYLIETHYDNPFYKAGIIDNSGLRLFYTPNLRKFDSAMLTIGHSYSDFQVLPPGSENWTSLSYCFSNCLSSNFPENGINITSVMLHTHALGRAVSVHVYRNGTEISVLSKDDQYDFDYQQSRVLKVPSTILPGDQFVVNCTYDTRDRNNITLGGLSSLEEMCYAFLMYYPVMKTTECVSYPSIDIYEDVFEIKAKHSSLNSSRVDQNISDSNHVMIGEKLYLKDFIIDEPNDHANKSVISYLREIYRTSPKKFIKLQQNLLSGKHKYIQECTASEGTTTTNTITEITISKLIEMPKQPKQKCPIPSSIVIKQKTNNNEDSKTSDVNDIIPIRIYVLLCLLISLQYNFRIEAVALV